MTANNSYGTVDTRTAVGMTSRNIKISADLTNNWGCRVLVYAY